MDELKQTIETLVRRKNATPEGSAARAMVVRQLEGLRTTREEAGPIIEDADPFHWGT
jgi:hypothetical protein